MALEFSIPNGKKVRTNKKYFLDGENVVLKIHFSSSFMAKQLQHSTAISKGEKAMRKPKWTFETWIAFIKNLVKTIIGNKVYISTHNTKMGAVPSVSLPAYVTCIFCGCWKKCYAVRLEKFRKAVRVSRFFRFHVSGDIPNYEYFCKMVEAALENPYCDILCFTKKYAIVNRWIDEHGKSANCLPKSLHMVFSAWDDLEMVNPYHLPEAHVKFRNGKSTLPEGKNAFHCFGCCEDCYLAGCGCWKMETGDAVEFDEH